VRRTVIVQRVIKTGKRGNQKARHGYI
jgi:hypothetical protein